MFLIVLFFFNVQIIEASQFSSGTKTFGYSLAGNLDVDNNGYPGRGLRFLTHPPSFLANSILLSPVSPTPPSLTHSLNRTLTQATTHPIIQPPAHQLNHSFIHSPTHSFIHCKELLFTKTFSKTSFLFCNYEHAASFCIFAESFPFFHGRSRHWCIFIRPGLSSEVRNKL